ncbi:hypothetical protein ACSFBX_31405 [Variovorax sp. RB2P76]|uniref:hypothetical protein n=1 Tax=Variovorax sp. RB2P76 TaxID=3443736 RepID=UPI003F4882B3
MIDDTIVLRDEYKAYDSVLSAVPDRMAAGCRKSATSSSARLSRCAAEVGQLHLEQGL